MSDCSGFFLTFVFKNKFLIDFSAVLYCPGSAVSQGADQMVHPEMTHTRELKDSQDGIDSSPKDSFSWSQFREACCPVDYFVTHLTS